LAIFPSNCSTSQSILKTLRRTSDNLLTHA
jgi:hypothetical protein